MQQTGPEEQPMPAYFDLLTRQYVSPEPIKAVLVLGPLLPTDCHDSLEVLLTKYVFSLKVTVLFIIWDEDVRLETGL